MKSKHPPFCVCTKQQGIKQKNISHNLCQHGVCRPIPVKMVLLYNVVAARFVTKVTKRAAMPARFVTNEVKRAAMPARFVTNEVVTNRAGIAPFFLLEYQYM